MQIESIFRDVYDQFIQIDNIETTKQFILKTANDSKINDYDKRKMNIEVERIQDLSKLQMYITNAMLKYQGLGVARKVRY